MSPLLLSLGVSNINFLLTKSLLANPRLATLPKQVTLAPIPLPQKNIYPTHPLAALPLPKAKD